jgi:hypothetical protein
MRSEQQSEGHSGKGLCRKLFEPYYVEDILDNTTIYCG